MFELCDPYIYADSRSLRSSAKGGCGFHLPGRTYSNVGKVYAIYFYAASRIVQMLRPPINVNFEKTLVMQLVED